MGADRQPTQQNLQPSKGRVWGAKNTGLSLLLLSDPLLAPPLSCQSTQTQRGETKR